MSVNDSTHSFSDLYDPHSPALQEKLYAVYRELRDDHPVYYCEARKLWVVTRYDDVTQVLQSPDPFSSAGVEEAGLLLPMIVFMDGDRHRDLRALLSRAFTPRRVSALEDGVRSSVRMLLDRIDGETCEFMHAFAAQLPSLVISQLIGIPEDRREAFLGYTDAMIETSPKSHPIREPAAGIYREFSALLALRREERRDDLMSALLDAQADASDDSGEGTSGVSLSDDELLGFCFNLIVGGTDTTMNLIGNGVALLAEHPEQRDWLCQHPDRIPTAIEEILRFESPTQTLPRRPSRDVEMHGVTIPKDSRLTISYGAANHDERVFADPEFFDVTRDRKERHLAFGLGEHHCLGASLARLESRVAFEELFARHPRFRVTTPPIWTPSRWARSHPTLKLEPNPGSGS